MAFTYDDKLTLIYLYENFIPSAGIFIATQWVYIFKFQKHSSNGGWPWWEIGLSLYTYVARLGYVHRTYIGDWKKNSIVYIQIAIL